MNDVPSGMTRIIPMLGYEDVHRASEWLQQAFGFRERNRYADPDGTVTQAELELDGGVLMIGNPGPAYQEPRHHVETCETARAWSAVPFVIDGVHVDVGDIDAHCTQARGARRSCPSRRTPDMETAGTERRTLPGTGGCSPTECQTAETGPRGRYPVSRRRQGSWWAPRSSKP
jgi:uncharacterized glyoxalase superfamily protein PhnB